MFESLQMVMISKLCVHMNLEEAVTFTLFFNPEFPLCTACRNYILVLRVETTRNELKQVVILCVGESGGVVAWSQQRQMQSTK